MGVMYFITMIENVVPVSDEWVEVTEERLDGVQVVVYQPKRRGGGAELRRAVIYLHGGGWCLGSASKSACQLFSHINGCFYQRVVLKIQNSIGATLALCKDHVILFLRHVF